MMEEGPFTAEQVLAALCFLNDGLAFERREQQPERALEQVEEAKPAEAETMKEVQRLVPDWIKEEEEAENSEAEERLCDAENVAGESSWLEGLGPDVSAIFLSHLSVSELSAVCLVSFSMYRSCRTNELWRTKFVARWNYPFYEECSSWYEAYKSAYMNPHDLWLTHWNCVSPNDGDAPGRCCLSTSTDRIVMSCAAGRTNGLNSPWMRYCPTCRYTTSLADASLPLIVQQAVDREQSTDESEDPVEEAEVTAAAHSLLSQEHDTTPTSHAKAIFATTQYAIAKWCRRVRDLPPSSQQHRRARQAFSDAATFHRRVEPDQYRCNSLSFLTDVLFFSMVDSHLHQTKQALEEMEHLRRDIYSTDNATSPADTHTVSSLGPHIETSHHSWHIVRFSNPDYERPIMFRIFVQRPDCFTVFPSEGLLKPGQTCHIVLGVRLLGSLLSEAFEALNVQREEVDPFLADVYAHEAHLPYAPFAIRYTFAPVVPCIPPYFTSRGGTKPAQSLARPAMTHAASSKYKHVGEYLWENVATEATVRTVYLSAHVHANYRFQDFQQATLSPFEIKVRASDEWGSRSSSLLEPLVYVAPNLLEKDLSVYEALANMRLELELSDAGQAYRTEKKCQSCARDWGARSEELGRAYILQRLVCDIHERQKQLYMRNLITVIRHVYSIVHSQGASSPSTDLHRVYGLLFVIHGVLVQKRADPVVGRSQRQLLLQVECVVDELCRTVKEALVEEKDPVVSVAERGRQAEAACKEDHKESQENVEIEGNPWRNTGVYKFRTCTDSVYGREIALPHTETELPFAPIFKDELGYLDGFRYLCHSPGMYCLGQQQDPNHEDPEILPIFDIKASPFSRVIQREKRAWNADLFMNNHTLSFACALSMIHDPRSLLVHGLYDRVHYPGTIARRPKLPPSIFNRVTSTPRDTNALIERSSLLVKKWKSHNLKRCTVTPFLHFCGVSTGLTKKISAQLCLQYGELDPESHSLLYLSYKDCPEQGLCHVTSLDIYVQNFPPPGVGRFPLSFVKTPEDPSSERLEVIRVNMRQSHSRLASHDAAGMEADWLVRGPGEARDGASNMGERRQQGNENQNVQPQPFVGGNGQGPGVVNLLWLMCAHFGWTVDDKHGAGSVLVDRKILIASQWVSNSLMAMPLLWTLLARYVKRITSRPLEYYLDGLPYELDNEMRYLTATECGSAAVLVLLVWLMMGRYAERRIGRSFERSMLEHLSNQQGLTSKARFLPRTAFAVSIWCQRQWDRISPLFLQRLVFSPRWNRRSESEVRNHVAAWRSKDLREHRSQFDAEAGQGVITHGASVEDGGPPIDYKEESSTRKLLAGVLVSLGSFCATSPHFFLNLLTVFSCSIALGMSMSLQSMEVGRRTSNSSTSTRPIITPLTLNTVVIAFFLVGQLVGSSGGVLFLAEFVVTSMSLLLGGAGTISASAMESWGCFFCLSSTAFWGYLFARVALIDGIRHKRRRPSSVVLCACLVAISGLWVASLWMWNWETAPSLMIVRPHRRSRRQITHHLQ